MRALDARLGYRAPFGPFGLAGTPAMARAVGRISVPGSGNRG